MLDEIKYCALVLSMAINVLNFVVIFLTLDWSKLRNPISLSKCLETNLSRGLDLISIEIAAESVVLIDFCGCHKI